MATTLAELRRLPHVSASQIRTFLLGPRRYWLSYVDHAEASFRPMALAFGTVFHEVAGEYLRRSMSPGAVPLEELHDIFRTGIDRELSGDGPPVLLEDAKHLGQVVDLGLRMINAFVAQVPLPDEVVAIERPFAVELVDFDTGEVLPVPLIGAVDALVQHDGGTEVWELKTAARRWGQDQLDYDLQMTAYRMATPELGVEDARLRVVVVTKVAKPEVQFEGVERGAGSERDLVATTASMLRAVQAGVDHPVRGWQCRSCAYAGACR